MREIFFVHDEQEGPHERQSFLEMAGYQVTLLKSADQCMLLLRERRPCLLLCDVLISGRNGFELVRAVRLYASAQELPIILCSQIYRSRAFRDEARNVGADRYLLHPIRRDEFVQTVNELVARSTQAAA